MPGEEDIPNEVRRGKFQIAPGLTLEVVNLDNGQRIITEESMEDFMDWLANHDAIEGKP